MIGLHRALEVALRGTLTCSAGPNYSVGGHCTLCGGDGYGEDSDEAKGNIPHNEACPWVALKQANEAVREARAARSCAALPDAGPHVDFSTDSNEDAGRIGAVLEALGYTVTRSLDPMQQPTAFDRVLARLQSQHRLTDREGQLLCSLVDGLSNEEIAREWDVCEATVKWHKHNLLVKTGARGEADVMRLVLRAALAR